MITVSVKILIALALASATLGEEIYENSTAICQRCTCINDTKFILDCKNKSFHNTIAEWPKHNIPLLASFSYNKIVHLEVLPDSDKVTDIIFSHCSIKSMDNGVFKAVRNVQYVDFSFNALTTEEIGPEKFKGPYNNSQYAPLAITHLDLSYNQIHSLPHNIFEHLLNLRQLNLEGNRFKVLDLPTQTAISTLIYLESLNLASNDLTELVGDAVKTLKYLKEINLSFNNLDTVPETLSYLGNSLEFLYLDNNPIFELSDESFLGVTTVIELSLTNLPRLTYVHPNTFVPIKNLKILYLHTNKNLFDINSEAFGINQTLKELYIQDNVLTDINYNLTKWSDLKLLNVSGNLFYCTCNLYKIAQDLNQEIRRNKDGPVCVDYVTGDSKMIYELTQYICDQKPASTYQHIITTHFRVLKLFITFIVSILIVCLLMAITIILLKIRRYRMNRNYSFATRVFYNPITNAG